MALQAGTRLGPYEVVSRIGAGGMGQVWLATELRLGRKVALKLLPADLTRDAVRILRFEQEARAASALNHPNVCTIHALGETSEGQHYIAMEYVEGETLRRRLASARLSLREALDVAIQVATALSVAHAAGIVHRDIKPENVMLRPDGVVKVLDFGLAKLAAVGPPGAETTQLGVNTDAGTVVGTAGYMSPEQARGQQVDARTDIWSLGVMLYEMLAGRSPFSAPSGSDVLAAILQNEPAPVARFEPDAPAELQRILTKTLRKDRSQRYQSVQDLLLDLQALREDLQSHARSGSAPVTAITTEPAPSGSSRTVVPPRRRRHVWLAVAAVVLALGTGLGVWTWRTARRAEAPAGPTSATVQRPLTRLTFAQGLQTDVTFSPDGRFIAYASGQGGNFDIWVQPSAGGGDPVRVTKSPSADTEPDWSPDGSQIVFRSERDGGGLFVVSALGGPERRISAFGVRPKWSRDGSRVGFASGPSQFSVGLKLFVVGTDGLPPVRVTGPPIDDGGLLDWCWHPDGRLTLLAESAGGLVLHTRSVRDARAVNTTLPPLLRSARSAGDLLGEFTWAPSGNAIFFEISTRDVSHVWRLEMDPRSLAAGALSPISSGTGQDRRHALSGDGTKLAFTTMAESVQLWSYPLDPPSGRIAGDPQPMTDPSSALPATAALSRDGRRLALAITGIGTGRWELWAKDLSTGRSVQLFSDNHRRFDAQWSPDSTALIYQRELIAEAGGTTRSQLAVVIQRHPGGHEELVSTNPGPIAQPHGWSPDGTAILASWGQEGRTTVLALWPLAAAPHAHRAAQIVAEDAQYDLWQGRFSPNGRWLSFVAVRRGTARVCVVPAIARSLQAAAWNCVSDPEAWTDKPRWSNDGRLLYVWRREGSLFNVWALPFDAVQGRVSGPAFRVTQFEGPAHRIWADNIGLAEPSVSERRMMLPVAQATGSVWMLDNVDK